MTIEPGTDVNDVVSFKLSPQFNDDDELEAVCVTDIQSAENIVFDNDSNNGNDNNDDNRDSSNGNSTSQGIGQSQGNTQ